MKLFKQLCNALTGKTSRKEEDRECTKRAQSTKRTETRKPTDRYPDSWALGDILEDIHRMEMDY